MDEFIHEVEFILGDAGQFILRHKVTFDFNAPAQAFVCAVSAVIGSHSGAGEDGHFKIVQSEQICSGSGKPKQEKEYTLKYSPRFMLATAKYVR